MKNLPYVASLSPQARLDTVAKSWKNLFILSCGQFLNPSDIAHLISVTLDDLENENNGDKMTCVLRQEIENFQDIVHQIAALELDTSEFVCLRALVLFQQISNCSDSLLATRDLTEQLRANLTRLLILRRAPGHGARLVEQLFGLLSSHLHTVSSAAVHKIFFKSAIGEDAPIDKIVVDIFRNSSGGDEGAMEDLENSG